MENVEEEGVCRPWNDSFILPTEVTQFKKVSEVEDRTSLLVQQADPSEFPGKKIRLSFDDVIFKTKAVVNHSFYK